MILVVLCAAFAPRSQANPITFAFTGTVTGIEENSATRSDFGEFSIGGTITGTYTFDSSAPDEEPANTVFGCYRDCVLSGEWKIGTYAASAPTGGVNAVDNYGDDTGTYDQYLVHMTTSGG